MHLASENTKSRGYKYKVRDPINAPYAPPARLSKLGFFFRLLDTLKLDKEAATALCSCGIPLFRGVVYHQYHQYPEILLTVYRYSFVISGTMQHRERGALKNLDI